jgi:putative ABC transport system substrate-binding protein
MVVRAANAAEIDNAFKTLAKAKPDALLIGTDAMFGTRYKQFIAATAQLSLPAIYEQRNAVLGGGLMSYGPSINEAYVQLGVYANRVLGGTKPQDLPVQQPTKFELAINGRTAKTLGVVIPQSVRLRADEIIE